MDSARERLLKRLAYDFAPNWCQVISCGGNHPDRDQYCNCSVRQATDILDTVEEFFELKEKQGIAGVAER